MPNRICRNLYQFAEHFPPNRYRFLQVLKVPVDRGVRMKNHCKVFPGKLSVTQSGSWERGG